MRKTILLTSVLAIVFFLADFSGLNGWLHPLKWIILSFFFCTSWMTNLLSEQGMANNGEKFIVFYLASVVIRIVSALVFITVILVKRVDKTYLFLANFFALYLCFTLFEIIFIVRKLRRFSRGV